MSERGEVLREFVKIEGSSFQRIAMADEIVRLRERVREMDLQHDIHTEVIRRFDVEVTKLRERLAAVEAERDMVISACRGREMNDAGIRAVEDLSKRAVKAEHILSALREPSCLVEEWADCARKDGMDVCGIIRAAVAAAEKEIDNE